MLPSLPDDLRQSLKDSDPDRYFAYLRTPVSLRKPLHVLTLFNCELGRIADKTRQPLLHEIRLQFWRDLFAYEDQAKDTQPIDTKGIPTAQLMQGVIARAHLPKEAVNRLINAHQSDTASTPFATIADMENHLKQGEAAFFELALRIALAETGFHMEPEIEREIRELSRLSGMIYGTLQILRTYPAEKQKGRHLIPPSSSGQKEQKEQKDKSGDIDTAAQEVLKRVKAYYNQLTSQLENMPSRQAAPLKNALAPLRLAAPFFKRFAKGSMEHYEEPELFLRMWWLMRYRL